MGSRLPACLVDRIEVIPRWRRRLQRVQNSSSSSLETMRYDLSIAPHAIAARRQYKVILKTIGRFLELETVCSRLQPKIIDIF